MAQPISGVWTKGHQNNIDRADDLARVLALEVRAAVKFRWKDKPDDHGQHNGKDDDCIPNMSFHMISLEIMCDMNVEIRD